MIMVVMSGNLASCAARTRPAGPQPTQDVDLLGQLVRPVRDGGVRPLEQRITGAVTVEVELHG
jgi:hypothetical protein